MSDRTGVLLLTIRHREGDGWPVDAELEQPGEPPLRRQGVLRLDPDDLVAGIDPDEHGRTLGEALFATAIGEAWALACARHPDRLHIALRLEDPDLRRIRWETLHGPLDGRWTQLRLDQRTPLSMVVGSDSAHRFVPLARADLRALLVVASPSDLADYGLDPFDTLAAVQCAREALQPIPCDVLAFGIPGAVGPPTLEALCAELTARRYAILHVVCHGAYVRGRRETVLYLADDDETTAPVPADKLLRRLGRLDGEVGLPHVVFLCACESAAPEAERALGGLGRRLVHELGLPAVVAMTDRISVDTATALIGPFYRQLAGHGFVDLALAEASTQIVERHDIATPLAFVRAAGLSLIERTGTDGQALPAAPPPPSPIFAAAALPLSLGARFVGRERDLVALRDLLSPETGPAEDAVAVIGSAGLGKTRLALEFMWRERACFPGGIFWLSAAAERRDAVLHQLLVQLDPAALSLEALRERGESPGLHLAAAVRAHRPGRAKLWVIEDVPPPEPGHPPFDLSAWCPPWGDVVVLAISRAHFLDGAIHLHELGPLGPAAGAELVQATAGFAVDPALARQLVEWVGGLPLALELLGKSLALGDLGEPELRELVARGSVARALGEAEAVVQHAGGGDSGFLSALRASYASLTPEARRLARLLAQLGPEPLPTELVRGFGPDASRDARAALVATSFVTGLSGHVFGTMHRVLADFLRGVADGDEPARACEVLIAGLPPEELGRPSCWPRLSAWAAHAEALLARVPGDETTVDLADTVGLIYLDQERFDEALRASRRAVELADRALAPQHPLALNAHLTLAMAHDHCGNHQEALRIQERVVALAAQHHDELYTIEVQASLALTLRDSGQLGRARELFTSAVEHLHRHYGPDASETLTAELNLGITLLYSDDHAAALAAAERLLPRLLAKYGPDDASYIIADTLRGGALHSLGRVAEARAVLEDVLARAHRVFGPNDNTTLGALNSLFHVLRGQGELARAHDLAADLLARTVHVHGPDHPQSLLCISHLARLEGSLGDWSKAHAMLLSAADMARARLGPQHQTSISLLKDLGLAATEIGAYDEARAALVEACERSEETLGLDHPMTESTRASLAYLWLLNGEPVRARDSFAELASAAARRLGEDHPEVLIMRNNQGLALIATDVAQAAEHFAALCADSRRVLGEHHIHTLERVRCLSRTCVDVGDHAGAREIGEANLVALAHLLGDAHPSTLGQRDVLATALRFLGEHGPAEAHARAALDGLRARLPPGHIAVRDTMMTLGYCLKDQERYAEARPLLAEAEPLCAAQLGEEHSATTVLRYELTVVELFTDDFAAVAARVRAHLPTFARLWGPDHIWVLSAENYLANAEWKLGDRAAALARLRSLVPRARAVHGDHPVVAGMAQHLAKVEAKLADADAASS